MKSNNLITKSKINTHSLKADNFKFCVPFYEEELTGEAEINYVPLEAILQEPIGHKGIHYLIYFLDSEERNNKVVVNKDEIDSIVAQLKAELGGTTVQMIGVVDE